MSNEALRFYKSGPPFHNYFPFDGGVIGKLIVLIPILVVLYPIMKSLPHLYDWVMRSKILRMYGELSVLEDEMTDARSTGRDIREMIARLDRLQGQAKHLRMPIAYVSKLTPGPTSRAGYQQPQKMLNWLPQVSPLLAHRDKSQSPEFTAIGPQRTSQDFSRS